MMIPGAVNAPGLFVMRNARLGKIIPLSAQPWPSTSK